MDNSVSIKRLNKKNYYYNSWYPLGRSSNIKMKVIWRRSSCWDAVYRPGLVFLFYHQLEQCIFSSSECELVMKYRSKLRTFSLQFSESNCPSDLVSKRWLTLCWSTFDICISTLVMNLTGCVRSSLVFHWLSKI